MEENEKQLGGEEAVEETLPKTQEDTPIETPDQGPTEALEEMEKDSAEPAEGADAPKKEKDAFGDEVETAPQPGKKKKAGRYKFHMDQSTYRWVLLELIEVSGKNKKNRTIAMVLFVLAAISGVDAGISQNILALLAASVLMLAGLSIYKTNKKIAKKTARAAPNGVTLAVEASAAGLKVQEPGQNGVLLPYSSIQELYDHSGYLSLVTGNNTSMNIPKDMEHPSYLAIERKLREVLGARYKMK